MNSEHIGNGNFNIMRNQLFHSSSRTLLIIAFILFTQVSLYAVHENLNSRTAETYLPFSTKPEMLLSPLESLPWSEVEKIRKPFLNYHGATGAEAVPEKSGSGYSRLHPPWKKESGRLILDYAADLPKNNIVVFSFNISKKTSGGDGVGVSVYIKKDKGLIFLGRCSVPPNIGSYNCELTLPENLDSTIRLLIVIDANRNSNADTVELKDLALKTADKETVSLSRLKSWILLERTLAEIEISLLRPDASPIMTPHTAGRVKGKNVYSARDSRRPMIGAHVYFSKEACEKLGALKDVFDYITHDAGTRGDRLCELAGIPWVPILHNPVPVNAYDTKRMGGIEKNGKLLSSSFGVYKFRLGATTGSEPHFSPDYKYTGHRKEEIDTLLTSDGGKKDFSKWLAGLYNDEAPNKDSNGDGITFQKDFGISADSWEQIGTALKKTSPDYKYLKTLFKEHVISDGILFADQAYSKSGEIISSRLLSPQYDSTFGQSLRQLRIPSHATGVTYYTTKSNALDPSATQMKFDPTRFFKSEKQYVEALEIRPPFWQSSGLCYGIFGPFTKVNKITFAIKTDYKGEAKLLFKILKLSSGYDGDVIFEQELNGKFYKEYSLDIASDDSCRYEFQVHSLTPDLMSNQVKMILNSPTVHTDNQKISLHDVYEKSEIGYILSSAPNHRTDIGKPVSYYSPEITEFRGAYIYSQAKRNGLRPLYNEFMPGTAISNTPQNVWRSIWHELQFNVAGIVWFCYSGGAAGGAFSTMDCHYLATELAVLRGQLELLNVYDKIKRPKRDIALFLPVAAPYPLENMRTKEQTIGSQLMPLSPDVFLSDQAELCSEYQNLIIMTGFMDGISDIHWNRLLRSIPEDKKIIVVMNQYSFTEPGIRTSLNFRKSLSEALPIFPTGEKIGPMDITVNDVILSGDWYSAEIKETNIKGNIIKAKNQPIVFQNERLLVLSGIPKSGLLELCTKFFDIKIPATRDSGFLRILNRDTTVDQPGVYCVDAAQTLYIPAHMPAFDLVKRQIAGRICKGENIIFVPEQGKLQLIDCGIAQALVKKESDNAAELEIRLPAYKFEGNVKPELILYAPQMPKIQTGNEYLQVKSLGEGFWQCSLTHNGTYQVNL